MLRRLILATGLALLLFGPAHAADPLTFRTEDNATKLCKAGNGFGSTRHQKSTSRRDRNFTARRKPAGTPVGRLPIRPATEPAREIEATG
jgi:hypothetical protein